MSHLNMELWVSEPLQVLEQAPALPPVSVSSSARCRARRCPGVGEPRASPQSGCAAPCPEPGGLSRQETRFLLVFFPLLFTSYLSPEITLEHALGECEIHDCNCYGKKREPVSGSNFEPSLFIKK